MTFLLRGLSLSDLLHALALGERAGAVEVVVDGTLQDVILDEGQIDIVAVLGLFAAASHDGLPLSAVLLNALLVVQLGVVVLADATEALPQGQVLGVNSNTVVLVLTTLADESPAALLLLEIQTGGIRKEEEGQEHAEDTPPGHKVELGLSVDVVEEDSSQQSSQLTAGSRDTVGGGTDRGGEDFTSDQEGDAVGTELVEETAQEVHGLEGVDVGGFGVVVVVEGRHHVHDEAEQEAHDLHPLAAVELVVHEHNGSIVAHQGDNAVDETPLPGNEDRLGVGADDLDKVTGEELGTVEENVVGEPSTSSGHNTRSKVLESEAERLGVVTSDRVLLLGGCQLLTGGLHVVCTVVDQPESTNHGDDEGDTVGPLGVGLADRLLSATSVEDKKQDHEDGLVKDLSPTLHGEDTNNLGTTVKTILASRELAGTNSVLHTAGGRHRVLTT